MRGTAMNYDPRSRKMPSRGKYLKLHDHLCSLETQEWRTSFREIESIIGFVLPASARRHRPWWANQRKGAGHSHALAWVTAGWETAEVDMVEETLVFRREQRQPSKTPLLDKILPVHSAGEWPEGLSLRREDMYEDRT